MRNATNSAVPYRFSDTPNRITSGDDQNIFISVSTSLSSNAVSYRGYSSFKFSGHCWVIDQHMRLIFFLTR